MFNQRTVMDLAPYATELRLLARRAHRVLSRAGEATAEHDLRELQAVLHQIAHLRQHFLPNRPCDLHRWLTQVEEQVKARQEHLLLQARPADRPDPVSTTVDGTR